MEIISWDEYFLNIAEAVSKRASCYRASVGCVLVDDDKRILSTGYNGAPRGRFGCTMQGGCYRDHKKIESGTELEKCAAAGAHAEVNAIINAARHGVSIKDSILYLVGHDSCCCSCQAAILNVGISKVVLKDRKGIVKSFIPSEDFVVHPILNF